MPSKYSITYVEGQGIDAKTYSLHATSEREARREAKGWLGGCRIGEGYVVLHSADGVEPLARWDA